VSGRLADKVPNLHLLNLQQCNRIIDELIGDVVQKMPALKAINYYGEEFGQVTEQDNELF